MVLFPERDSINLLPVEGATEWNTPAGELGVLVSLGTASLRGR